MKGIKLFLTVLGCSFTTSAMAAISIPVGWYVEGNLGSSRSYNVSYISNTSASDSGLGWNVNGGFKFLPYVAFDAGYTGYSGTSIRYNHSTKVGNNTRYSFQFAGKGILPLYASGFELFGKIGAAKIYSITKVTNYAVIQANNLVVKNGTYTSTSLYFGGGGDYSFTNNLSASIQWMRAKGNSNTGSLDLISAGLTYIFS